MPSVIHRRSVFGRSVVCDETWHPTQKATNKAKFVTCPRCKELRAVFRKSAAARAKLHGIT